MPKETGGTPNEPVGRGGTEGGGEVEARQDGAPEAGEITRGRRKGPVGGAGEERREIAPPTGAQEGCWAPRLVPTLQGNLPTGCIGPGGIGRRLRGEQERQMGGALREEQERRRGCLPHPLKRGKLAGLPGEVPCPLRPGVGDTPWPLLFR